MNTKRLKLRKAISEALDKSDVNEIRKEIENIINEYYKEKKMQEQDMKRVAKGVNVKQRE